MKKTRQEIIDFANKKLGLDLTQVSDRYCAYYDDSMSTWYIASFADLRLAEKVESYSEWCAITTGRKASKNTLQVIGVVE